MAHPSITQRGRSHFSPHSTARSQTTGSGGRDRPDSLVALHRIAWSRSTGFTGRDQSARALVVDSIPRNAIGKALRREMPRLLASQLVPESRGPSTPTEQALLAIWHKVLRRDDIGVTDNVFQFGADPLRAKMASGLIAEASGVRMSTKVLYAKPTVREQAAYCAAQREQP